MNKTETLSKVIEDALSDSTKPKERLAIYKALSEILDDLGCNLQIESLPGIPITFRDIS